MTFVAAYIYKDTVQVVADSAVTVGLSPTTDLKWNYPVSSFGEAIHSGVNADGPFEVSEGALKIYNVKDKLIIAFAGAVDEGVDIVQLLNYEIEKSGEAVTSFLFDFFINKKPSKTQFVGGYFQNGDPHIFRYISPENIFFSRDPKHAVFAGIVGRAMPKSSRPDMGLFSVVASSLGEAHKNDIDAEEMLVMTIAMLQLHSLHVLNIQEQVGGFYNGVALSETGIKWADDTLYSLYSMINWEKGDRFGVFKFNRDNATFLLSHRDRHQLFHAENQPSHHLIEKWGDSVIQLAVRHEVKYIVFMCHDQNRRTMVIISNRPDKRYGIETKQMENGEYTLVLNQFTWERMLKYSEDFPYVVFTNFKD